MPYTAKVNKSSESAARGSVPRMENNATNSFGVADQGAVRSTVNNATNSFGCADQGAVHSTVNNATDSVGCTDQLAVRIVTDSTYIDLQNIVLETEV